MKQRKRKPREAVKAEAAPPPQRTAVRIAVLALCVVTVAAAVAAVWAVARPIGDLYIALAAGRDIVAGKLGKPDEWSFLTADRVWINQNWGTHLLCYLSYLIGGDNGLLVLKAVMVAAVAGFLAVGARQRGNGWPVAVLVGGGIVLAARGYIDMRPNLTTLVMAPILVAALYLSRRGAHWIWLAVAVVGVWANMHGGFLFGIGLLGLWGLCRVIPAAVAEGPKAAIRRSWPLLAAPVIAVGLAAFANPFGIENVIHPLTVGRSEVWRQVAEWRSVFEPAQFGSLREFCVVGGILAGLLAVRSVAALGRGGRRPLAGRDPRLSVAIVQACFLGAVLVVASRATLSASSWVRLERLRVFESRRGYVLVIFACLAVVSGPSVLWALVSAVRQRRRLDPRWLGLICFDAVALAVATTMALEARRFIPLAMIMMAPPLAAQVSWLLRSLRRPWLICLAAVGLLIPTAMMARAHFRYYAPNNPLYPRETIFQRMHKYAVNYSPGIVEFVRANDLHGRVFHEWRWEGFLRWYCPQLKLFVGGRAQQVYTEQMFLEHGRIGGGYRAAEALNRYGIRFVILPQRGYKDFYRVTADSPTAQDVPIYYDGRDVVVANGAIAANADLIRRAAAGTLRYGDPATAALSRAWCLACPAVPAKPWEIRDALVAANALRPLVRTYESLAWMADNKQIDRAWFLGYLLAEQKRLAGMDYNRPAGIDLLAARIVVAKILAAVYGRAGRAAEAARFERAADELVEAAKRMRESN